MTEFEKIIVTALLTVIIGLLAFIAKKLQETLNRFEHDIQISIERHNVHDLVISQMINENYNSRAIAEDKSPWPKIFINRSEKEH